MSKISVKWIQAYRKLKSEKPELSNKEICKVLDKTGLYTKSFSEMYPSK